MITFLFLGFLLMLLVGIPISVCLVFSSTLTMIFYTDFSVGVVVQKMYSSCDSFPLVAIPFFILAGNIMSKGGMSKRLINLAQSIIGNIPGGLGMASVLACMFFSSISGSTAATTAAIGIVLIPAMIKTGFSPGAATSLQATAGSIGIIIPPSLPFVLLGVISGISIGDLFMGGILPGIILGSCLMIVAHVTARVQKHKPSGKKFSVGKILNAFWHSVLSLLTVFFVVGGILAGFVTPTEAAIVAVVWSFLVSAFIYKELKLTDISGALIDTVKITGVVVLCIAASSPFAWLMTIEEIPGQIAHTLLNLTENAVILKLLILAILLGVGTFLDLTPAMILLFPILMPVAEKLGMHPVHFGVVLVMALGIGQCTPPVGIALFVACSVAKTRVEHIFVPLIPYLLAMLIALLLVTFTPFFSLWLRL